MTDNELERRAPAAFEELDAYGSDIERASHQTATNAIQRYVARLDSDPLMTIARAILPEIYFDVFYAAGLETTGSMVGSGRLAWPTTTKERVALQGELLRRIAGGQIDLIQHTYNFHYVENRFDTNIRQFVEQEFEPFHRDFIRLATAYIESIRERVETTVAASEQIVVAHMHAPEYISAARLNELAALRPAVWDLRKLIRLCEEIDGAYKAQSYLAVAALTRALLDHVPPIFGHRTFAEVANNYADGGRSFKDSMEHLQNSARRIGDAHLHNQIRNSESLPTSTQVNFSNDLDVMLAEIVRVLS